MICRSGNHDWFDEINARRCCSGRWYRALRRIEDIEDLDEEGRTYAGGGWVYGWVRLPEEALV